MRASRNSKFRVRALATLILSFALISPVSIQSANAADGIPAAARLIGNGGNSRTILNPNSAANFASCAASTGIRGITSDGTYVYYRPSGDATIICRTTPTGTFVSAHTILNDGQTRTFQMYSSEKRALTFANGCILFRGGGNASTDKGYDAGSDIMCVDTTNWTMYGPFTPTGNSIPLGGFWLTSNIMNFPDGRVGAVSAPNAGVGTGPACSEAYCKYLRLYNVSRTGNSLTFAFDRDITLADSESGWPNDDHGMATDGTYLYQIMYNSGYKVWQLSNTAASTIVFNGSGSWGCGAVTAVSGGLCEINTSVGWSAPTSNATFFGRSHATNQYIMGDYNVNNRFWTSDSVAPPAGIGSDVTAPVLSAQSASSLAQTTATLNFTSGEAGTYYYLIYASASSAPDTSTIISQGASPPTVVKGTSSATASANTVAVTGLSNGSSYKAYFVVKDSSGNTSLVSTISFTTVVSAPAFTLSASSATRTYLTSGTAFTTTSTGGLIASFAISATPAGMSFDTSTGTLTGAPTTIAAATTYTITATNVSGTATQNFVLTVTTRPITIKAVDKTVTYSGSSASVTNSNTITSGALAGSDTFTTLTYTYSSAGYSASVTAPTNAGSYTITPSAASFSVGSASNYSITYDTSTLTINKANQGALTITSITSKYGVPLRLVTAGGSGTGALSFAITSAGSASGCLITSETLTASSIGTCKVTATKALDANYFVVASAETNILFTVADTLTVTSDTPTALTYTGSLAAFTPTLTTVSGLVSGDVISFATYNYSSAATTCATGGTCSIGQTGPGGGLIFITPTTSGNTTGKYFEAAPAGWSGTGIDPVAAFCSVASIHSGALGTAIGTGEANSNAISSDCIVSASDTVTALVLNGKDDWFMPSFNELKEMYTSLHKASPSLGGFSNDNYWSSTDDATTAGYALQGWFGSSDGITGWGITNETQSYKYRPVRSFLASSGFTYGPTTTKPTNAGTYTITPSALTFSTGAASNYAAITYRTSTLTINKAAQSALVTTPLYNVFNGNPTSATLLTTGGSDTGTVTYAYVAAGSTAVGCALSGADSSTITVSSAGTCSIVATKAATNNYLVTISATATITFYQYISYIPAPRAAAYPVEIVLSGATAMTSNGVAPTITTNGVDITKSPGVTFTISGSGFVGTKLVRVSGTNAAFTVLSDTSLQITMPSGLVGISGPVYVEKAEGSRVSEDWVTGTA